MHYFQRPSPLILSLIKGEEDIREGVLSHSFFWSLHLVPIRFFTQLVQIIQKGLNISSFHLTLTLIMISPGTPSVVRRALLSLILVPGLIWRYFYPQPFAVAGEVFLHATGCLFAGNHDLIVNILRRPLRLLV